MNPLTLRYWPDPILHKKCAEVVEVNDEIRELARNMLDCMYVSDGIGLAAPQVGVLLRIMVVDTWWPKTGSHNRGLVFINPELTLSKDTTRTKEGCLSLPEISEFVSRSLTVHVKALDIHGQPFELDADGLLAICIQHELDHLNGLTMVDRVGPTTRRMLRKQLLSSIPPPRRY